MTMLQTRRPDHLQAGDTVRTEETLTDEIPVLDLVEPLPGFPDHRQFALVRLDDDGVVCALRSVDDPQLRFVVVPPGAFFADYAPHIDDTTVSALEATSEEDLLVLVMVNATESAATATANLLAPVVVNHRTRKAAQVLLHDDGLSLRAPLVGQPAEEKQRVR
jgi:flagellar assembly factor FliW